MLNACTSKLVVCVLACVRRSMMVGRCQKDGCDDLIGRAPAERMSETPRQSDFFLILCPPCTALPSASPFATPSHPRGGHSSRPSSSQKHGRMNPSSSSGRRPGNAGCPRTSRLTRTHARASRFALFFSCSNGTKATLVTRLQEDDKKKTLAPEPSPVAPRFRRASTSTTPPSEPETEVPGIPSTAEVTHPKFNLDILIPETAQPEPEVDVPIVRAPRIPPVYSPANYGGLAVRPRLLGVLKIEARVRACRARVFDGTQGRRGGRRGDPSWRWSFAQPLLSRPVFSVHV